MTATTIPVRRSRPLYALAAALAIGAGLLWRSGLFPFPDAVAKYGGDSLWALVVFLCFGITFHRGSAVRIALLAVGFAWAVEFLQLYHAPWIDWIRSTRLGRLVLGTTFNSPDLLAYVVGIAFGAIAECVIRKPNTTAVQRIARASGTLALLAITGFCIFGFMATFEYSEAPKRWPWQIGYGAFGLVCLSGAAMLLRSRRRSNPPNTDTSR
jgi:predicted permease